MSGAGDGGPLYVSSWGWTDGDGLPVRHGNDPIFRKWSVSWNGERVAMLLLPLDVPAVGALIAAGAMLDAASPWTDAASSDGWMLDTVHNHP